MSLLLLAGCSSRLMNPDKLPLVHRIDVQQGNVVTQDMLAQLEPGMEKSKVRFILGTPLIVDVFHNDRWDYVYTFQEGGGKRVQRRVSLFFKDDRLVSIDGNVRAAAGPLQVPQRRDTAVEVPGEARKGFISRMKETVGFGDDEAKLKDKESERAGPKEDGPERGEADDADGSGTAASEADQTESSEEAEEFTSEEAASELPEEGALSDAPGDATEDFGRGAEPPYMLEDDDDAGDLEPSSTADSPGLPPPEGDPVNAVPLDAGEAADLPDEPAPARRKGFFGRMLEKVGIGDDVEDAPVEDPGDRKHREPPEPEL